MKRIGYFLTVGALAAAMLAGCSTSNQKAEGDHCSTNTDRERSVS